MVKCGSRRISFFRSPWVRAGFILCLIGAAGLTLLPYGIAYGIKQVLTNAGMGAVSVADVDFNPLTGHLEIRGLAVIAGDRKVLDVPAAEIHFAWLPLWQRQLHIESAAINDMYLSLKLDEQGSLQLTGSSIGRPAVAPGDWIFRLDKLRLDGRLALNTDGFQGALVIENATLTNLRTDAKPAHLVARARLNDGTLHLRVDLTPFAAEPTAKGAISLEHIPLTPFTSALKPYADKIEGMLDGHLEFESFLPSGGKDGRVDLLAGNLAATGVRVGGIRGAIHELRVKNIEAAGLRGAALADLDAAQISASSLEFHASGAGEIRIGTVKATNIHAGEGAVFSAGRVNVANAEARLARDAQGRWSLGGIALGTPRETTVPSIRLSQVWVTDSRIHVRDETVSPPFSSQLTIHSANIGMVDSRHTDRPIPFALEARVGKFGTLSLAGEMQPFAKPPNLKLRGDIKQLSLSPFSAYAVRKLGYQLKTGQLDAVIEVAMHQGQLAGTSKLVLRRLAIKPTNPSLMRKLTDQLSISLDGALDLLRNDEGTITLKVPFSGDLTNPEFDFSNAINQAIGKAVQQAAIGYLKYALQPYGTFIAGAELALEVGKKVFAVRVDPLLFPAGSAELGKNVAPYLQRLASVLKQHPDLQVSLCGRSSPADVAVISPKARTNQKEALLTLARQRAEAVKLVLSRDFSIAAGRLFLCLPEYEEKTDALPRVDVFFD